MQANSDGGGDSWQKALGYSKKLGYVPLAIPVATRTLIADSKSKERIIRPVTKYQIARILRGSNFKSMLYYVSDLISRDTVQGAKSISVGELMDLYSPMDLAALLSCYVSFRLASKSTPKELLDAIRPHLAHESYVGALVGVAIPALELAGGILWGCSRHIAHMLMSSDEPRKYKQWRAKVGQIPSSRQSELEVETWGCTSSQVASMVLANMGLGNEIACLMEKAASYRGAVATITETDLQNFRLAVLWFECFLSRQQQPTEKLAAKMFPFETDRIKVEAALQRFDPATPSWLERSGADISPELTPALFSASKQESKFEVPEQLQDVFKLDELTKMDEWEFDTLVAHIDREIEETSASDGVLSQKDLNQLEALVS